MITRLIKRKAFRKIVLVSFIVAVVLVLLLSVPVALIEMTRLAN